MTRPGTKLPLRSDHYGRIEAVVIDAFVRGRPYTQRALASAMAKTYGIDEEATSERLVYYLRQLAGRGMYEAQAGRFGSKGTEAKGSPTSPRWFNWSGVAVDQATFRHALEPFLRDPEVPDWRKEVARKAMRFLRELPTQCPDDRILLDSTSITAEKLYDLPNAVHAAASERFGRQTAKNYRGAITAVLQYGAERRLIPLVFPYFNPPDAWAEFTDRYFPLALEGPSSRYVRRHRNGMSYIRRAAMAIFGPACTPEHLDRAGARKIVAHLSLVDGELDAANKAMGTLRELARAFKAGPFSQPSAADEFFVQTRHGLRPAIYLRDDAVADQTETNTWDALLALLERMRFPQSTIEYLRWYRTYITMPARELMRRDNRGRFPHRRDAHHLSPNSLVRRAVALRAYLGAAVNVVGLRPETLTPDVLFGSAFDEIAHGLVDWWQDRRDALVQQGGDTAIAGALAQYLVAVGMICYTRYELLRFERRLTVAVTERESKRNPKDRVVRIDTVAEEGAAKTREELAAWDAYRQAYAIENQLQARVKDERGANRAGAPEFKDIKLMMQNTPPQWFIKILNRCIERVREGVRKNHDDFKFHKLVRNTVDLAFHISTGCRSEESCLVRMDDHLTPEQLAKRVLVLRAFERKNNKAHEVILQPAYLPDDVLSLYLECTRSFFMRDQYLRPHRVGGKGPKVTRPELVKEHAYLLVSTRGHGYGVDDLSDESEVLRLAQRAQDHGRNLQRFLAREAVRCGLKLPGRRYELGTHVIRGVFAYALYVMTKSAQVAAHYLGDEEQTVRTNYSAISGVHVDSSALIGFDVGPQVGIAAPHETSATEPTTTLSEGGEAEYLAKMEALRADRRAGIIDQTEFEELKAAYRRLFGREGTLRASADAA